jgi:hypothetical protein
MLSQASMLVAFGSDESSANELATELAESGGFLQVVRLGDQDFSDCFGIRDKQTFGSEYATKTDLD